MVVVRPPLFLAEQAGGVGRYELDAASAAEALRELPVADLLFDERGVLRPLVNVYVDGVDVRERGGIDARRVAVVEDVAPFEAHAKPPVPADTETLLRLQIDRGAERRVLREPCVSPPMP